MQLKHFFFFFAHLIVSWITKKEENEKVRLKLKKNVASLFVFIAAVLFFFCYLLYSFYYLLNTSMLFFFCVCVLLIFVKFQEKQCFAGFMIEWFFVLETLLFPSFFFFFLPTLNPKESKKRHLSTLFDNRKKTY